MFQTENLQEKWSPVLAHPDLPKIDDAYKRAVTTVILENQEKAIKEDRNFLQEAAPTNATGADVENWDPILISLVRNFGISGSVVINIAAARGSCSACASKSAAIWSTSADLSAIIKTSLGPAKESIPTFP